MWGSNAAGQRQDRQGEQERPVVKKYSLDEQGGTFQTKIRDMLCKIKDFWVKQRPAALQKGWSDSVKLQRNRQSYTHSIYQWN